jgi:hypothetical protein
MGSGHQMLTIAGIFLLSFLILTVNKNNSERSSSLYKSGSVIDANGVAQSIIDEIQCKAFDENTITKSVWSSDSLTIPNSLGPESGETLNTQFDDVDDYNNYSTVITVGNYGDFNIHTSIKYVMNMSPDNLSNSQTYSKRIEVAVTNFSYPDTLKYYHVISY